jgi:hypothetical protein
MPEIEIRFASDREYERLRHIRDKYGVQWRGMLIQGAKRLEGLRHPALSRVPRERPVRSGCTERPTENDTADADTDASVDRRQSFES